MDDKKLVIKESYVLNNIACYQYTCGRCGAAEAVPQIIVKTFNNLAPCGMVLCGSRRIQRVLLSPVCKSYWYKRGVLLEKGMKNAERNTYL